MRNEVNHSASVAVGNIQPHSAGELYPWHVELRVNHRTGLGYCVPFNGESGEHGPGQVYREGLEGSFEQAHRAAEAWIRWRAGWSCPICHRLMAAQAKRCEVCGMHNVYAKMRS